MTASPPTPGPDSDDGKVEAWGAASDVPPVRDSIAVGIIPLDIERDMWQSFAAVRRQRTLRLVKAAAGLVRIIICAACSAQRLPIVLGFRARQQSNPASGLSSEWNF